MAEDKKAVLDKKAESPAVTGLKQREAALVKKLARLDSLNAFDPADAKRRANDQLTQVRAAMKKES